MDLLIHYWGNGVCTCYMGSQFTGRSTTDIVLETFQNGISEVDESKFMQVSSDRPNVNLAFLKSMPACKKKNN